MTALKIENLRKTYGKENQVVALDGVSFTVEEGELTVILGPSGSGKSTLLNILGGMDGADSGSAEVFGENVVSYSKKELVAYRRNKIGFVFQFYNLMPNLTALENVALSACQGGMTAREALEGVGLLHRANNFPSALSGGEQQRVAIARAIVKRPRLLLSDEPTGALDSKTGQKILLLLEELKQKYRTTVVIVTHNANLALIADRVIRLSDGKVVENRANPNPLEVGEIEW